MDALSKISAVFAFAAAALWLWSAVVRTPQQFHIQVLQPNTGQRGMSLGVVNYVGYGVSPQLKELALALKRQSRLSAAAALCAAASALLQGATFLVQ